MIGIGFRKSRGSGRLGLRGRQWHKDAVEVGVGLG